MISLPKGIYVSGQGPAVILLHSSLSSSRQWMPLVELLESDFTVINIDILGYGAADKVEDPDRYNFSVETDRIEKIINSLITHDCYHLVGHSCGGALALKIAVENPQKVLSLSLYEPVAFHLLVEGSQEREIANKFAKDVDIDDSYLAAEKFTNFWNREGFFKLLPERMQHLMASDMKKVNLDFIALTSETYTGKAINNISAPVMMMVGLKSPQLSKTLAGIIVSSLNNVEQVNFNTGHMGPISSASIIQPKIAEFICDVNNQIKKA